MTQNDFRAILKVLPKASGSLNAADLWNALGYVYLTGEIPELESAVYEFEKVLRTDFKRRFEVVDFEKVLGLGFFKRRFKRDFEA